MSSGPALRAKANVPFSPYGYKELSRFALASVCTITNFTSRCHSRLSRDVVSTCAGKTTGPIVRQKSLRCHHVFCLVSLDLAIFFVVLQIVQ